MSLATNHFPAGLCAPPALFGAWATQGMVGRMALADFRTLIAYVGTELTEGIEPRRVSAHPAGGQSANVTAIATKARALGHKIVTMMLCHADHVIGARFTGLSAGKTGIDAVLLLLRQWVGLHNSVSFNRS